MKVYGKVDIKIMNRRSVFQYIKNKPGQTVSRPELAKALHITDPTVLKITDFLTKCGILREVGEADTTAVGRKPSLLAFEPEAAQSIGIEYDGSHFGIAVVNLNDETVSYHSKTVNVPLDELFEQTIPAEVFKLALPRGRCLGLGLALPAAVNTETYTVEMRNPVISLGGKHDFFLAVQRLERVIGMPVYIENDVNAAATAQLKSLGTTHTDFIYIMLGLGLGAGIVLERKIRKGVHCSAGEIGYMTSDWDFLANMEKSGWLESQLNRDSILNQFSFDSLGEFSAPPEKQVIDYYAKHLALVIANLSAALDLDTFVLGGRTAEKMGVPLMDALRERCQKICVHPIRLLPETSEDVIVRGMGAVVNEEMLPQFLMDSDGPV